MYKFLIKGNNIIVQNFIIQKKTIENFAWGGIILIKKIQKWKTLMMTVRKIWVNIKGVK